MDVVQIRADIATVLASFDIRAYPVLVDNPVAPCAVIVPNDFDYHATLEGSVNPEFTVELFAPAVNLEAGQNQLDEWISTESGSLMDLLDSTEGLSVLRMQTYQVRLFEDGQRYVSAQLIVEVLAE